MNYTHPLQQQYNKKIRLVAESYHEQQITVNNLVTLLSENQIKFFSCDDVAKVAKLCNPFDKLNIKKAITYLELIYVHVVLEVKYFIVKFSGRSYKTLNLKPLEPKKIGHQIESCLLDFRKKMIKLYGKQSYWFKALGGVSGSNHINKQIFYKKICKIFSNTPHSYCIIKFINYLFEDDNEEIILWQVIRQKLVLENHKNNSSVCYVDQDQLLNQQQKQMKQKQKEIDKQKDKEKEKGLRITSIGTNQSKNNLFSCQQNEKVNDSSNSKNIQTSIKRRRLKTLQQRPRLIAQSWNLALPQDDTRLQSSIHSKNRYNIRSSKKCQTSLNNYPQNYHN